MNKFAHDSHFPLSAYLLDGVVFLIRFWFVRFLLLLTDRDSWHRERMVQLLPLLVMRLHPLQERRRPSLVLQHNNSPRTRPLMRNTGTPVFISRPPFFLSNDTDRPGLNMVMT